MNRTDGLLNVVNGLNTLRYDPSRHTGIVRTQFITPRMSENLYIENGIFRKIVTVPCDEALRNGFFIKEADEKANNELQSVLEDLEYVIHREKRRRMIGLAKTFVAEHPEYEGFFLRFDIVFLGPEKDGMERGIRHLRAAFTE